MLQVGRQYLSTYSSGHETRGLEPAMRCALILFLPGRPFSRLSVVWSFLVRPPPSRDRVSLRAEVAYIACWTIPYSR